MAIYLDNAATTRPCQAAIDAIHQCLTETYGNPSSLHHAGLQAQLVIDGVRRTLASVLACEPGCIHFTSGATESNNLAVRGVAAAYGKHKPRVITTTVEHASVREAFRQLELSGFEVIRIAPDSHGVFDPDAFVEAVNDRTCLISMMLVNNETGHILPVRRVFYGAKRKNPQIITHCDAVQGFLKVPIRISELKADLLSLSGHKIHAAKGVGALYVRKGVRLTPLLFGGEQEHGLRPGTEPVPLIAGMGAAAAELAPTLAQRSQRAGELRSYLLEQLSTLPGITVNSPEDGSPYILNFSVANIRSEIMLHFLESKGIYVSSGSACSKGANSGVLEQFGATRAQADSAIRVSLCPENVKHELRSLVQAIAEGQATLKTAK
ncbi:cysteine desulfurase family protein [Ruminococcus sp.]|uniref:cysteine desulfurase family protein n=1 Tax=Ruminococcus sp. TaxID=41978 RepID=UPI0025E718DA|nr:cysteine desulfurase family protein [Ruminococcus sp.]MCI5815991.1 cysteine desulfurase [Ruminococcus sp.]MDD7555834.1 cysteine desulfurase family protein [Ruminococcus sp.]MDY4964508.1 cysteine desulfurase family protein [Ruminococcus callidus]